MSKENYKNVTELTGFRSPSEQEQQQIGRYPMRRKTLCFSYGDIRCVHRIYASN